jgi:predicted aspartyl protease
MGTFFHPITLHSASGGATETVEALVDAGSTFTAVPSPVLERLGVTPHRAVRLRLADDRSDERRVGRVLAELDGSREEILCAFDEPDDLPTTGAHTLEAFLLTAGTVEKRLVPVDAFWV